MVAATLLGRPAAAPLLALLDRDLVEELFAEKAMMRTFGYLVALEMNVFGYYWNGGKKRQDVRWPFDDRTSRFTVFQRGVEVADTVATEA